MSVPRRPVRITVTAKLRIYAVTLWYCRFGQIFYRYRRAWRSLFVNPAKYGRTWPQIPQNFPSLKNPIREQTFRKSYLGHGTFSFLNKTFDTRGDWFPHDAPRLWVFNLHYFDYLFEIKTAAAYEEVVGKWIHEVPSGRNDGWHPYTASLRISNWIWTYGRFAKRFTPGFSKLFWNSINNQLSFIRDYIEFDVLGNHLLENCKALIIGGLFTGRHDCVRKGVKILSKQVKEQILPDGGHFERSPMYHSIVLEDLITIYLALEEPSGKHAGFLSQLEPVLHNMARYLQTVTFDNRIALLNDSAWGIAAEPVTLVDFVRGHISNPPPAVELQGSHTLAKSGVYVYHSPQLGLLFDVGGIGPDYLAGHGHNGMLSFMLWLNGEEIITDSGVYQYQGNERLLFKSTRAHNTVMVNQTELNEIWGDFRVGQRGRPVGFRFDEGKRDVSCGHTCYRSLGVSVARTIRRLPNDKGILVIDRLTNKSAVTYPVQSFLHFAPGAELHQGKQGQDGTTYNGKCGEVAFQVTVPLAWQSKPCRSRYSPEFGIKTERPCIEISGAMGQGLLECSYKIMVNPT